jgi:hypothetical protein
MKERELRKESAQVWAPIAYIATNGYMQDLSVTTNDQHGIRPLLSWLYNKNDVVYALFFLLLYNLFTDPISKYQGSSNGWFTWH